VKIWIKLIKYIDQNNPSIYRIEEKCINCGLCEKTCNELTGVEKKDCIYCGQCILTCPTGALTTKYNYKKVLDLVKDSNKPIAISVAPAVRVSLYEEFGKDTFLSENYLPSILKKIGFTYVFDVTFGADVTIYEEASEFVERLKNKKDLPLMTSCCPSYVDYVKKYQPKLAKNISTTKSPIGITSSVIKSYYKRFNAIDEEIISVVVAPCTAKKYEIINSDTDYIITVRELAMMIRECNIDIDNLKPSHFDILLSKGSKGGVMFGRSGGVMSSLLNTTHYFLTGNNPAPNTYNIQNLNGVSKLSFTVGEYKIKAMVIAGIKNLVDNLDEIKNYDIVEVMNCPYGCTSGGGQPLVLNSIKKQVDNLRVTNLNNIDAKCNYAHENNELLEMYKTFFKNPLSQKAIDILHNKN
jgi:Iron only hydrogenase large subunit, C-terminal domain